MGDWWAGEVAGVAYGNTAFSIVMGLANPLACTVAVIVASDELSVGKPKLLSADDCSHTAIITYARG